MKITTEQCVLAILRYFYEKNETDDTVDHSLFNRKLWKRLSKSGSGNKILRVFQHKTLGTTVNVYSTETQIYKTSEWAAPITGMNIKSYLRTKTYGIDFWDLPYEVFGEDNVVNWPQVTLPEYEGDDGEVDIEPLDMENFEWISIKDDEIEFACGGDWQEPLTLTIKLIEGKLTVTNSHPGFGGGMDEETFIKTINA